MSLVQNYQVCLFLDLDTVWEGEVSRGVRAGKGRQKKEMREKRKRESCEHPLLCSITQAAATVEFFQDSSGHTDVELTH